MGDGRHRQDPGRHGRYLIAGIGILVVLALLGIGAYALYSVLTAAPNSSQGSTSAPRSSSRPDNPTQRASAIRQSIPAPTAEKLPSSPPTLALTVTGTRSYVAVTTPDGQTLLNQTLRQGDRATFRQPELKVTIGAPSAVRVEVDGLLRDTKTKGLDTFTVSRAGASAGRQTH